MASYFVITVQTTVTLTMCFIVYNHKGSFLNLCRNKKNNSSKVCKLFTLNKKKKLKKTRELMHTNYNSVWLINIDLIILKVIPQPAHYLK